MSEQQADPERKCWHKNPLFAMKITLPDRLDWRWAEK
jgi:hypothetical protein